MKLPKNILAALEEFWVEEYKSDYRHLFEIEIENPAKVSTKTS